MDLQEVNQEELREGEVEHLREEDQMASEEVHLVGLVRVYWVEDQMADRLALGVEMKGVDQMA